VKYKLQQKNKNANISLKCCETALTLNDLQPQAVNKTQ